MLKLEWDGGRRGGVHVDSVETGLPFTETDWSYWAVASLYLSAEMKKQKSAPTIGNPDTDRLDRLTVIRDTIARHRGVVRAVFLVGWREAVRTGSAPGRGGEAYFAACSR